MTRAAGVFISNNVPSASRPDADVRPVSSVDDEHRPVLVVGDLSGPAGEYVRHRRELADEFRGVDLPPVTFSADVRSPAHSLPLGDSADPVDVVVFLNSARGSSSVSALQTVHRMQARCGIARLLVITSAAIHTGDQHAAQLERVLLERFPGDGDQQLTLIRIGCLLNCNVDRGKQYAALRWLTPFLSRRLTGTFVSEQQLHDVLDEELCAEPSRRTRTITLLGERRAWSSVINDDHASGPVLRVISLICHWCGLQAMIRLCLWLAARVSSRCRALVCDTLRPSSNAELLSLFNRHNARHVRIAGANNGVTHFGWQFPGKTVVSTVGIRSTPRVRSGRIRAGAGSTLKSCILVLRESAQEFLVVPNFSWISVGTSFFVPVHGSGSEVSTLGESIEQALLYDTSRESFVRLRRGEPAFRDAVYRRDGTTILLRVVFRVRPQSRYLMSARSINDSTAAQLLEALHDPEASNIEIRKSRASSSETVVRRWTVLPGLVSGTDRDQGTVASGELPPNTMEVPRDSIGRVWDRIEENRLAAFLFHWFVRTFGFHVELFLTPDEFRTFWEHHTWLPISKIQLRLMRRDHLTHSPCCDQDLVSVDLFTTRRHRRALTEFLRQELPGVRTNPGKQSL